MRAKVKHLLNWEIDEDSNYNPVDVENFEFWIEASIGPEDQDGEELFQFGFCTPQWLASQIKDDQYIFGRFYIIVEKFDYELFKKIIESIADNSKGENWAEIAQYLSRYGYWEFEDYKG